MKINNINPGKLQKIYQQQKKEVEKQNNRGDRMDISGKAREIQELEKKLEAIPEVRREKVEEIKTAIQNGAYEVNAEKVAEKILTTLEQE